MLNVYKSNRMENLADALGRVLDNRLDDPLMPDYIGVQSQGMKQWIAVTLAERTGICANTRFLFLKDIVERVLDGPGEPEKVPLYSDGLLLYVLMDLLPGLPDDPVFAPVFRYTADDPSGMKTFHVCRRMAGLFDDYQVYRPHMLRAWHDPEHDDPRAGWQAELFRRICGTGRGEFLSDKVQSFLANPVPAGQLFTQRLCLFGVSAMPPLFMALFSKIASVMELNLFLLSPSREFFGYIRSEKEQARLPAHDSGGYLELGNPLLAAMGKPSREFHLFIENFDYHEPPPDLFHDPAAGTGQDGEGSPTMLALIQSDILNLKDRGCRRAEPPVPFPEPDGSICFHACHTPLREAEVLKDQLLELFDTHPDCHPHDIIVMMPDIETYAPYIEAVFGTGERIPYTVSDRRTAVEYELVEAVLTVLRLARSRCELSEVLELLHFSDVAGRFGFSGEDIDIIETMCSRAGIFWGRDAAHRESAGLPRTSQNTWAFGLQRLMLGVAMPENHDRLVFGRLPLGFLEGLETGLLGRLAAFCDTLFSHLERLSGRHSVGQWCEILARMIPDLVERHQDSEAQYLFILRTLGAVRDAVEKAGFDRPVDFEVMMSILEQQLGATLSSGAFMAGRLTFCNIMPMRSIPFRVVVLMGMNDQDFPRNVIRDSFDLIRAFPEPGDKIEREEDRNLFLEALLSARDRFWITFTGMDVRDNSEIPPAPVVTELIDVICRSVGLADGDSLVLRHPLNGFDPRYFDRQGDSRFFSYSRSACQKAVRMIEGKHIDRPFFTAAPADTGPAAIDARELIRFLSAPLTYFMRHHLGILLDREEAPAQDREPDALDGLAAYELGALLTDRRIRHMAGRGRDTDFEWANALGKLPHGQKGMMEYHELDALSRRMVGLASPFLSRRHGSLLSLEAVSEGMRISAAVSGWTQDELFWITFGRLAPKRLLSFWVYHLLLNLQEPENGFPVRTEMIGKSLDGKSEPVQWSFTPTGPETRTHLDGLIRMFRTGRTAPVMFFPDTSFEFARRMVRTADPSAGDSRRKAVEAAARKWCDPYRNTGDGTDRYARLFFRKADLFESVETLSRSGFMDHAVTVFLPLLNHLEGWR